MKNIWSIILFFIWQIQIIAQTPFSDSILTSDEKLWLEQNKINISFAPNPSWPPGDYFDENGIHQGIVSDYIKIFEQKLGVKFNIVHYQNWNEIINGLENAKIDFVGGIQKTENREAFLNFTKPFLDVPLVILVNIDNTNKLTEDYIKTMTLACVKGYTSLTYIKNKYPETKIIECEDDLTAILKTSLGNTDGTVVDLMAASYIVEKYGINNLFLGTKLDFTWELRFATRIGQPELGSILDTLLTTIDNEQKRNIFNKWVHIGQIRTEKSFLEENLNVILALTGILIFILAIIISVNFTLRKLVRSRTLELQVAKESAELSEEKYKLLVTYQNDLVVKVDLDGKFLFVSPSYCKMFGKTEEELLGKTFMSLVHEDDLKPTMVVMNALHKPPYNVYIEQRAMTADGWKWIAWVDSAILDVNNNVKEIIGVGRDISDKKRTEEELKKAKDDWENVFNAIGHPAFILDKNQNILNANDVVVRITGKTRQELLNEKCYSIFHKNKSCPPDSCSFIKMMESGKVEVSCMEVEALGGFYMVSCTPVFDENGKLLHVIHIATNITKIKETENKLIEAKEKAEESNRLKTAFLANLSHEIRTPMNAILGFTDLLKVPDLPSEKRDDFINIIHKSGNYLLSVITDIVEVAKIDSKQISVNYTEIDINKFAREIYDSMLINLPKDKTIGFLLEMSNIREGTIISTDTVKLKQIILNIITNAFKYSLEGEVIFKYNLTPENNLEIIITDTGIGIPKKYHEVIFERFRQVEVENKMLQQGSGLGLSICKAYADLLGGTISVESETDKGSTFKVSIPIKIVI
jgi:PAS domain S-box-containing protein